jgi:hypothetical protein
MTEESRKIEQHTPLSLRLVLYPFTFWVVGILLAFKWGLGWFFLIESLRRLLTYIPSLNQRIKLFLVGDAGVVNSPNYATDPKLIILSKFLAAIILLAWIGITIFVFLKVNIPLSVIFKPSQQ